VCEGHGGRGRDLESLEKEMDCGVEDVCVERIGRGFGWVYLGGEKRWVAKVFEERLKILLIVHDRRVGAQRGAEEKRRHGRGGARSGSTEEHDAALGAELKLTAQPP